MQVDDLRARATGVGGSEVPAIANASPHESAIRVWQRHVGDAPPFEGNDATEIGKWMEPWAIQRYERGEPDVLVVSGVRTLRSIEHPWCLLTPDGLVFDRSRALPVNVPAPWLAGEAPACCRFLAGTVTGLQRAADDLVIVDMPRADRVLEVKTHSWGIGRTYGDEGSDEVPADKLIQGTWYAGHLGVDTIDYAVVDNTHRFRTFRVGFHRELFERLMEIVDRYWHHNVAKRIPPDPDGSSAYDDYLARKHRDLIAESAEADLELEGVVRQLAAIKRQRADAEKEEKRLQQVIGAAMGAHTALVGSNGQALVTWRRNATAPPSWKDVSASLRDRAGITDSEFETIIDEHRGLPPRMMLCKVKPQ